MRVGALLVVATALLGAGCGTGGLAKEGDLGRGKQLFVSGAEGRQSCGSCHALADAGTKGVPTYPNLDDAFGPARAQGFEESTIREIVRDQIELAEPPMPPNLVRGEDADAVAAYVAKCAGWTRKTPCVTAPAPPPTTTEATTTEPTTTGAPPDGDAEQGRALYTSLGCQACHSLDGSMGAGPTFEGVAGSQITLDDGTTVTADDAYLLESILDPDAKTRKAYPKGLMSATIRPGSVPEADAKALVAFINSLR